MPRKTMVVAHSASILDNKEVELLLSICFAFWEQLYSFRRWGGQWTMSNFPVLTGQEMILWERGMCGCVLIDILPKSHVEWEIATFQGFGKGRISNNLQQWNLNFWAIREKYGHGHLEPWHFQHRVPCWTAGLLFHFLVSSQPHNLSKLHTPQWLWLRPAKIVESCCQVESGFFMSSLHRGTVSLYAALPGLRSLCWKQVGWKCIQTVRPCLAFQIHFVELACKAQSSQDAKIF